MKVNASIPAFSRDGYRSLGTRNHLPWQQIPDLIGDEIYLLHCSGGRKLSFLREMPQIRAVIAVNSNNPVMISE